MATYAVVKGDTLWAIAARELGDGARWREILDANPTAVSRPGDPRTLQIGAQLVIPGTSEETTTVDQTETAPPPSPTDEGLPVDTDTGAAPVKAEQSYPGLLAGGKVIAVERPGLPDTYAYAFEYPKGSGSYVSWQFDSLDQIEQAVGPGWQKTIGFEARSLDWFNKNVTQLEDIGAVTGLTGNFYAMMDQVGYEAASEAGIRDPSLVGKMLNDPEMQAILAQATFGDLSEEQVMAMKRNTNFWKQELYPGIENLYGSTTAPEAAWVNYTRSVEDSLTLLGYERDADGTYKSQIGKMLNQKIEDTTFNEMAPTFLRAEQNAEYANVLSTWNERVNGKSIEFGQWFDVLDGATPAELGDVVELAGLQYQADQQGLGLAPEQIARIGELGDLSEQQAAQAFTQYSQILTSLAGTLGADPKYDITEDEILSLTTGIKPLSGRSSEEIRRYAAQAAKEAGALDDQKIQFFVGYDPARGTAFRPGLNPLAPEGA